MAGAGFKTFTVGEVLTAGDVNTYLMEQAVMSFADSGARGSAIGTATEGMLSYLADTDAVEVYDGSAWVSVAPDPVVAVKQVVVTTLTTSFQAAVADNTWQTITGLSATITPTDASSTLIALVNIGTLTWNDGLGWNRTACRLYDGSSPFGVATSVGSRNAASQAAWSYSSGASVTTSLAFITSGSAGSTSARTYDLQMHNAMGSTRTLSLNRSEQDSNNNDYYRAVSSIVLLEV